MTLGTEQHDFASLLSWLDDQQDNMVETVQHWSKVNSGTTNLDGLATMADLLVDALAPLDGTITRHDLKPSIDVASDGTKQEVPFGQLIHFSKRPEAPKKILLTGHYDTVFPKDSHFQTPKFIDDNTLNGPGVADMKGGILVMLNALMALEKSNLAGNIGYEIIFNPDEETGSHGSGDMLAERAKHADFGMTFEPALADGTLAGARKGSGNFAFVCRGLAAHAGREFHKGRNAIWYVSRLVADLYDLNGIQEGITINPGVIEGGSALNVVPDLAICRFNVRAATFDEMRWMEAELDKLVAKYNQEDGFSVELTGNFNRPPKELSGKNLKLFEMLKACGHDLGLEVQWKATGGCCDGNNLAAAGLPNIDTLGVRGGLIHSDQEFVLVDSFAERAKLSALLMLKYAAGEFDFNDDD